MELPVRKRPAGVTRHAIRLAREELEAPARRVVHCRLARRHPAIKRRFRRHQRALIRREGPCEILRRHPRIVRKCRGKGRAPLRLLRQPHRCVCTRAAHLRRIRDRFERLIFKTGRAPVPKNLRCSPTFHSVGVRRCAADGAGSAMPTATSIRLENPFWDRGRSHARSCHHPTASSPKTAVGPAWPFPANTDFPPDAPPRPAVENPERTALRPKLE